MTILVQKSWALLVMAAFAAGFSLSGRVPEGSGKAGVEMRLPFVLSDWYGKESAPGPAEKRILPPDTEIEKMIYAPRNDEMDPLQVSIVLSGKDRTSIHRPEVCLTAQGWNVKTSETRNLILANGQSLSIRLLGITREVPARRATLKGYYAYWFVCNDSTTEDHMKRILSTATNSFLHQSNPRWAYISVLSIGESPLSVETWIREAVPQFQSVFTPASYF